MLEKRLKPRNPNFAEEARAIFQSAPFIREVGYELISLVPGRAETGLTLENRHMQQNNFVHAGVVATMTDHTAGGAAGSLVAAGEFVLTVEYKINLLRPTVGERLRCVGEVIKNGRTILVADSYVYAQKARRETLVARATVTLAVVRGGIS